MSPFIIEEHVFDGQHIREYPKALASSQEDTVRLHAKSYTPQAVHQGSKTGDITIVAFHANAFPKEVYEPFFEQLYLRLKDYHNILINTIWIADQAAQGTSAILNDDVLGNDPSWFDHSRDVLAMVNTFRSRMKRPIIAIGHSMGATQALATAHLHPRLFEGLIMIDPPISPSYAPTVKPLLQYALSRPETYKSRDQLDETICKLPLVKGWDQRAVQRYLETAFHTSPTTTQPNTSIKPFTSKYVEAKTLVRPNTDHVGVQESLSDTQRAVYPNVDPDAPLTGPVYNAHSRIAWSYLPGLRPPALYLLGAGSRLSPLNELEERTNITGTGPGGSGGRVAGKVASVTIPGGHFLPMTNVEGTAEAVAEWIRKELERHRMTEKDLYGLWKRQTVAEKQKLEPPVEEMLKSWDGKPWPKVKERGTKSRM